MAGNKINTKTKGKEEKSKVNKGTNQAQEESEDLDYTLLRKPILTSITGFAQARKIFDLATEELKNLLSTECDLLYECKVCRNLFRSLANFISHKRIYCREKFNSSVHSHFIKPPSTENEIFKIKRLEEEYQESLKEKDISEGVDTEVSDDRIPLTKDLTAIIEKIARNRGIKEGAKEDCEILLQNIPKTSVAVFQNVNFNKDTNCDIRSQVKELDSILSQNNAILQSDGRFKILNSIGLNKYTSEQDNVIQISDDDENDDNNDLKCKICDLQFSTQKTLRFHMKYKHLESRLVYPCPDCLEIFSTSWSVYRHLFKVHRKTAAQIRRLRESIQAKAFRMNNPPAFYEKRKNNIKPVTPPKISEEERLDQENQAWMDNMEGDGELPRCGGCGRTFERRAALAAHTHTCQPRSRALARRADTKKIEIQIRKDYHKGPPTAINIPVKTTDDNANKLVAEDASPLPKALKESQNEDEKNSQPLLNSNNYTIPTTNENVNTENKIYNNVENFVPKLPFAQQAEKSNLAALKVRMQRETDLDELVCRKCDVKHNELQDLYDHMAGHYNWIRYACKLCNFKHYNFDKLPEHVKVVHKLRGDSDFYCTTVKAVDGAEALEICEQADDANENSPDSRRPSRCSSDSSRLSDDSSSSSTRVEVGAKKRKMNTSRTIAKKRKEAVVVNDENEDQKCNEVFKDKDNINENELPSNAKVFEENSSDVDEIDDKVAKKHIIEENKSISNRRPIRKRTRPKNEDFEYDLSNLLKMEAQGYRDSQSATNTKSYQSKKKVPVDIQNTYEIANKDCCGALATLSKKAVENSVAHMKVLSFCETSKEQRATNIFVRPLLPKVLKADKISPRKEGSEDMKETIISNKKPTESKISPNKNSKTDETLPDPSPKPIDDASKTVLSEDKNKQMPAANTTCETVKTNVNIPAVVPFKFRRQSLEVMKNPLINKNIKDLSKAGMKTKILVIKPINRNKDGTQTIKTPLKFQTIKLKDPNRGNSSNDEKPSDHVVVVQVPKVECSVAHPSPKLCNTDDAATLDNSKRDPMDDSGNKNNEKPVEINTISSSGECNNVTEPVTHNPECISNDKVPSVDKESSVN